MISSCKNYRKFSSELNFELKFKFKYLILRNPGRLSYSASFATHNFEWFVYKWWRASCNSILTSCVPIQKWKNKQNLEQVDIFVQCQEHECYTAAYRAQDKKNYR